MNILSSEEVHPPACNLHHILAYLHALLVCHRTVRAWRLLFAVPLVLLLWVEYRAATLAVALNFVLAALAFTVPRIDLQVQRAELLEGSTALTAAATRLTSFHFAGDTLASDDWLVVCDVVVFSLRPRLLLPCALETGQLISIYRLLDILIHKLLETLLSALVKEPIGHLVLYVSQVTGCKVISTSVFTRPLAKVFYVAHQVRYQVVVVKVDAGLDVIQTTNVASEKEHIF